MDDNLAQGDRLGRYRLLTQLGRGGMASVWVALERAPGGAQRFVALKAMLPRLARQSTFRSMFLDEGQLVRSIDHPGVVPVYEVGEDRGVLFMAMEWVEGDSLHTLIKEARRRRAVPPEMAVRMIADVAGGLHEAHELRGWDGELRGVVHCDVSPHNILIGLDGHAKLTDFGVAHAAAMSAPEREGMMMGKVGYMSPEQAVGARLDRRSDVFSLGVVLFELTTGKRLFGRKDMKETLELVQRAAVPPPTTVWSDYPRLLEPIVMQALARDPARRFKTAEDFRRMLEQYLIETRTLVSPAGVGRLLTRVLGAKMAERRDEVRASLAALREPTPRNAMVAPILLAEPGSESERSSIPDGTGAGPVGPSSSSAPFEELDRSSPEVVSGSVWAAVGAAPSSGTVAPHVVDSARPLRQRWPWLVAGIAVAAAGGAATVALLAGDRDSGAPASPPVGRESGVAAERAAAEGRRPGVPAPEQEEVEAISLDNIPVAPEPARPRSVPPAAAGAAKSPHSSPSPASPQAASAPPPATAGAAETPAAVPPEMQDMDFLEEPKKPATTGDDLGIENPYR